MILYFLWMSFFSEIMWQIHPVVQYILQNQYKLMPLQVFLNLPTPAFNLSNKQTKDLCLLLLYVKQYHYGCKSMQKKTDTSEIISKFIMQLEIEVWHDSATLLSALYVY